MRAFPVLASVVAAAVPAAAWGVPTVLYSTVATSATSLVPGSTARFSSIDRPERSPDGSRWIVLARNDSSDSTKDSLYLAGAGTAGVVALLEGTTEIEPGRAAENMSNRRASIDDAGNFAVAVNLTGATSDDGIVAVGSAGGGFTLPYREGTLIGDAVPSARHGASFGEPILTSLGVAVRTTMSTSAGGVASGTDSALFGQSGAQLLAREGTPALRPTGQIGSENWSSFDFGSFYASADGSKWLVKGNLTGASASNQVLAANNQVVLQEDTVIPGMASPILSIITGNMGSNGDWFARGENDDDAGWVVRNGALLVDSDDPVAGGMPGESFTNGVWRDPAASSSAYNTFFVHTGNNLGDYVYAGFTTAPDGRNAVWVFNGSLVFLREGDGIDLDGNGLLDDDAFVDVAASGASLNNKVDGFLTDDLFFVTTVDLRDGAGARIGEALIRVAIPEPSLAAALLGATALLARRRG